MKVDAFTSASSIMPFDERKQGEEPSKVEDNWGKKNKTTNRPYLQNTINVKMSLRWHMSIILVPGM